MQDEGKVQVVNYARTVTSPSFSSLVVEMGARGEAVEMIALHISISAILPSTTQRSIVVALSTDPSHEVVPPVARIAMFSLKALYGFSSGFWQVGASGGARSSTEIIPLYGLVRPRRQILVWAWVGITEEQTFRVEIYYRPVSLNKEDLDALNLKYGKYRRMA